MVMMMMQVTKRVDIGAHVAKCGGVRGRKVSGSRGSGRRKRRGGRDGGRGRWRYWRMT